MENCLSGGKLSFENISGIKMLRESEDCFKTGDIVEIDDDDYIHILDRKKLMIVPDNGKNVSQARIETLCDGAGIIAIGRLVAGVYRSPDSAQF